MSPFDTVLSLRMLMANKLSLLLTFFLFDGVSAQVVSAAQSSAEPERSRVALVLSGGGARGLAHIGVLRMLEEMRVPVDCVVGTSMGALVGGIYAAGVSPREMQRAISETNIAALFDDTPPRSEIEQNIKRDDYLPLFGFNLGFNDGDVSLPPGVSAGYKFELFLKQLIGSGASVSDTAFDDLPTPYRAIASDLENGELKVFSHGELPRVMRASMSLPAIVAPTEINGRLYVDGGLVNNLPVTIGRELCGDRLIVVNLGTPPKTRDDIHNSIDVAMQSVNILTQQNVATSLQKLKPDDILIVPDLEGFDSAEFSSQDEIIERGEQSVRAKQSALSTLVLAEQEYLEWRAKRSSKKRPPLEITAIHASDTGAISAQAILRDIHVQTGEEFNIKQLNRDIVDLYGRGDFSYVSYSIIPLEEDENQAAVDIKAVRKPWGPGYLKLGLGAATDFSSPTQLNLALSYRKTWVNALGAEWRTDMQLGYDSFLKTEFIQPLQFRDGAFISPYAGVRRNFIQFYQGENRIGQFTIKRADAGLDFGLTGFKGELRLGPYIRQIKSEPDFGLLSAALSPEEIKETGIVIRGILDQLDSFNFPRSGVLLRGDILTTKSSWGSDSEYTRATASITAAKSFGKNTVQGQYHWGDALDGHDDISIPFKLGGLMRLSGLYLDQLTGTRFDLATVSYYRQYASLPSQIGRGMYLGMSLETGRIDDPINKDPFEWINAGSIFWGADTVLGRIYIGYGRVDIGQHSWYLEIGPQF